MSKPLPLSRDTRELIAELQSSGVRVADHRAGVPTRRGGAGPSDHKAATVAGHTVMLPVLHQGALSSPFSAVTSPTGEQWIERDGRRLLSLSFPQRPRFYDRQTEDGIPYWKIATLHGVDVLATTVLQDCIRYASRKKACHFCSIGQSLAAGRTIAHKSPAQLGEVARAAVELDGVKHMVMTTGTPNLTDRGASVLCDSARGIKAAVELPLQGQCEPPDDDAWFRRMHDAGIDSLGMHLEVLTPALRQALMPGKATVPLGRYMEAFAAAVEVFGRGQVSTYVLAGLGDSVETTLAHAEQLIALGVYPFVVPFTPIGGTPLEDHPPPSSELMRQVLAPIASMLQAAGMRSGEIKAGCGKCGACSSLSTYEAAE
ncbi:MAG: family radical protein [Myxococcaceae bacterium]|nr:family radical protein [Myxococcaceae bacterium]